jgi:DNA-binding response OmpR family regulator
VTRVLVVEDNPDLAFAVASALEADGYEVETAGTGPDAVRLAASGVPRSSSST